MLHKKAYKEILLTRNSELIFLLSEKKKLVIFKGCTLRLLSYTADSNASFVLRQVEIEKNLKTCASQAQDDTIAGRDIFITPRIPRLPP